LHESRTRYNRGKLDPGVHASDLAIDEAWESKERRSWAAIEAHKVKDSFVETDIHNTQHKDSFGYSESTNPERFLSSLLGLH
jgi:hypothetical protein